MACQMTRIPMTLSELEGHFVVTSDKVRHAIRLQQQRSCIRNAGPVKSAKCATVAE